MTDLCPGNCIGDRAARLTIPSLGATVVIAPSSENGVCSACGRSRECSLCHGALGDRAHNTLAMHADGADGGTGCPVVRVRPEEK